MKYYYKGELLLKYCERVGYSYNSIYHQIKNKGLTVTQAVKYYEKCNKATSQKKEKEVTKPSEKETNLNLLQINCKKYGIDFNELQQMIAIGHRSYEEAFHTLKKKKEEEKDMLFPVKSNDSSSSVVTISNEKDIPAGATGMYQVKGRRLYYFKGQRLPKYLENRHLEYKRIFRLMSRGYSYEYALEKVLGDEAKIVTVSKPTEVVIKDNVTDFFGNVLTKETEAMQALTKEELAKAEPKQEEVKHVEEPVKEVVAEPKEEPKKAKTKPVKKTKPVVAEEEKPTVKKNLTVENTELYKLILAKKSEMDNHLSEVLNLMQNIYGLVETVTPATKKLYEDSVMSFQEVVLQCGKFDSDYINKFKSNLDEKENEGLNERMDRDVKAMASINDQIVKAEENFKTLLKSAIEESEKAKAELALAKEKEAQKKVTKKVVQKKPVVKTETVKEAFKKVELASKSVSVQKDVQKKDVKLDLQKIVKVNKGDIFVKILIVLMAVQIFLTFMFNL